MAGQAATREDTDRVLSAIFSPDRTPEGLLHAETCRMTYFSISALCKAFHKAELQIVTRPVNSRHDEKCFLRSWKRLID